MDGRAIPWQNATTHVSAHALHYGSGVFEGMRCYETTDGPAVFRLDSHLDRLYASAEIYGIAIPFTREELTMGVDEIVCDVTPEPFHAVGQWYKDFSQTTDEEVSNLLEKAASRELSRPATAE